MTNKTQMPEPDIFDGTRLDGSIASHGYSAASLEVYADAKVRVALEKAAKMVLECDPRANHRGIATAIRALIPEQKATL